EPGEIEAALAAHPGVAQAAVVAREDEPGHRQLVAYLVPANGAAGTGRAAIAGPAPDPAELRAFLSRTRPDHMLPPAYVTLPALPLSPNGKLDRQALPAPDRTVRLAVADHAAPGTDTERTLATIWADVLHRDDPGIHDDFFDLGGDSIRSLLVASRASAAFEVSLTPRDVLAARTIAALAQQVEELILRELEDAAFSGAGVPQGFSGAGVPQGFSGAGVPQSAGDGNQDNR